MDYDEAQIERFVRRPDTFDEATRRDMEAYLEENAHAREVASFYRSYYASLDELEDDPDSEEIQTDRGAGTSTSQ